MNLDSRVFVDILDYYSIETTPNAELITIDHLLNHTVGLWPTTTRSEDPMFSKQTLNFR